MVVKEKELIWGDFFSNLKDKIADSTGVSSVSEQLDRLNDNLEKFSKDSDYYKLEITKITNIIPKEINNIEYFKQSTQALKIILMIIAVLLLMLIVVLLVVR